MPIVHAVAQREVCPSFRVRQVQGMFDLQDCAGAQCAFDVEIPAIKEPWNIGLIVGPSGSGKTTVAQQAFEDCIVEPWEWPARRSVLDGFPSQMGISEITQLLSSVGFSSPPAWLRPFEALSTGEQFRVNMARTLAEMPGVAVVDEFTSVIDRTVAKIGSTAIAKAVRQRGQKFVAVTCHYDVMHWLEPDWVVDMADQSLARGRLPRPQISLEIVRCDRSAWKLFQRHHYLTASLHRSASCYVGLIENRPAVFVAVLQFPHPCQPGWREHRCVCLPDFQGLGIGTAMSELVASIYAATGRPYLSVTSHPAMILHRMRSPLWKMTRAPSRAKPRRQTQSTRTAPTDLDKTVSWRRLTATFKYIGPARHTLASRFGIQESRGAN